MTIYVLQERTSNVNQITKETTITFRIKGTIKSIELAKRWEAISDNHFYVRTFLNDPAILNAIAHSKLPVNED